MNFKNNFIEAKDHLVSGEIFKIKWDPKKGRAATQVKPSLDLSAYYNSPDYTSHKESDFSFIEKIYVFVQNRMFRYKASIVKQTTRDKTLLDFGSGIGAFCSFMREHGYNVSGIEPMNRPRTISKEKGLNVFQSLKKIPKTVHYDIITLWHVLEHLPKPEKTINKLAKLLHTKGVIIVAVPNLSSYDSDFYGQKWAALDVPRHLWHFTSRGVLNLMHSEGFFLKETHPLWFDALYISYLSEKHRGSYFPFLRGVIIGLLSNFKALFTGEYSSLIYVFSKSEPYQED